MANNPPPPPPSDIFRFVSVRGVNLPEADAKSRRFVLFDLEQDYQKLEAKLQSGTSLKKPLLLVELPQLKNGDAEYEAVVKRRIMTFFESSPRALTEQAFDEHFPDSLRLVALWHRDHNRDHKVSRADFVAEVEKALGGSVGDAVAAEDFLLRKIDLWENLLAQYLAASATNGGYIARLVDMVRWFWILEKIGRRALEDGQEIYEAMHATVVLPDNCVQPAASPPVPEEPNTREEPPKQPQRDKDRKRIADLDEATRELTYEMRNLTTDERHAPRPVEEKPNAPAPRGAVKSSPSTLSVRRVAGLSETTQAVLRGAGLVDANGANLERALERIENEKGSLLERSAEPVETPHMLEVNGRQHLLDRWCHEYTPPDPCAPYRGGDIPQRCGLIRPPGMADLKVIRTVLLKYEAGELAHVENILKGESKVREFNTMKRTEDTLVTEEETTTETEKETQTTDRFELEKELSSMSKEDMKIDTGVKVTAKLGPVNIDTHFDFQYNTSKEESNKTATKNSQETMNRALNRVIERRRTQRTVTQIVQTDDKNRHELSNLIGPNNIHGLYYWLDKYYLAKVVNYGKRLMFEFVIPEPAAFYLYSKTKKAEGEKAPPIPMFMAGVFSYNEITESNYLYLAAYYGATDVGPPPPSYVIVGTALKLDKNPAGPDQADIDKEDNQFTLLSADDKLKVPAGYIAHHADISFAIKETSDKKQIGEHCTGGILGFNADCRPIYEETQTFHILIGNRHLRPHADDSPMTNILLNTEDAVIPFAIEGSSRHFICNVEVICYRTDKRYREWKNSTFNSLLTAYNTQLTKYEDWVKNRDISAGVVIEGNNPELNRRTEHEELKKHCIEMMTGQRFETFDAMRSNVPSLGYPEFSFLEAFVEGNYLQFFEQAFEWEQMTYVFYPYYWGRKPNWIPIKKINDPDPIFTSFLQAGAARVLVPARPGFAHDVCIFFASGGKKIWGGKQAPIPGSKHWLPIIDELKEQEGQFEGGAQEGDPWIYKVPTTLVYLDDVNAKLLDKSADYPNDLAAASKPVAGQFS
jgi:hypothetical protein